MRNTNPSIKVSRESNPVCPIFQGSICTTIRKTQLLRIESDK
jgi:hypothetical protein